MAVNIRKIKQKMKLEQNHLKKQASDYLDFGTTKFYNTLRLSRKKFGRKFRANKTHPHPCPLLEGERKWFLVSIFHMI